MFLKIITDAVCKVCGNYHFVWRMGMWECEKCQATLVIPKGSTVKES